MTLIDVYSQRPPVIEAAPGFDEFAYSQAIALGSEALGVQQNNHRQPCRAVTGLFDYSESLSASLQNTHRDTTLGLLEGLLLANPLRRRYREPQDAAVVDSETARLIFRTGLVSDLLDLAQTSDEAAVSDRATDLLFYAFTHAPAGLSDDRVQPYLARQLPNIVERANDAAVGRQEASAQHATPHTIDEHTFLRMYQRGFDKLLHSAEDLRQRDGRATGRALVESLAYFAKYRMHNPYASRFVYWAVNNQEASESLLGFLGIPPQKFKSAIKVGYGESPLVSCPTQDEYREACFFRMLTMENQEPGICSALYRGWGIRNFARFPESMLLGMYRDRNVNFAHRIYLISASSDSNGSATRGSMPKFEVLRQQLRQQNVGLSVVEVASKRELQVLARIARSRGLGPASMIMLDSHGFPGDVPLGEHNLFSGDCRTWLGALAAEHSLANAIIFLDACSTGKNDNGFADCLREGSGRDVWGATGGMALKSIQITVTPDGTPHPQIENAKTGIRKFAKTRQSQALPPLAIRSPQPHQSPRGSVWEQLVHGGWIRTRRR